VWWFVFRVEGMLFLFYLLFFFVGGFVDKFGHMVFGNGLILKFVNMERG